jgi:hypothetical protein
MLRPFLSGPLSDVGVTIRELHFVFGQTEPLVLRAHDVNVESNKHRNRAEAEPKKCRNNPSHDALVLELQKGHKGGFASLDRISHWPEVNPLSRKLAISGNTDVAREIRLRACYEPSLSAESPAASRHDRDGNPGVYFVSRR